MFKSSCIGLICRDLKFLQNIKTDLDRLFLSNSSEKAQYYISSITLYDCFHFLNQQEEESLVFMTGMKIGNIRTIEKIITFKFSHQSIGGVRGDPGDALKALLRLDKFGHALYATVHIHPGFGVVATCPSAIDTRYQESLECGKYKTVMGIFSRDGYVRFFNLKNNFEIYIFGKGIEEVVDESPRVFKLLEAGDLQRL
jgi:hypothetical protein